MNKPRFKPGDKVYRISPKGYEGYFTITSEGMYFADDELGDYYYLLSKKDCSAWENQLISEDVYNSPLFKLMQETD